MFLREHGYTESVHSPGHTCPVCCGQGTIITTINGETERIPCDTCKGRKKLDAEITIRWSPAK